MSEINSDSVYGGSMTPEEWVAAEMEVDAEFEAFDFRYKSPGMRIRTPEGEMVCHHGNSIFYEYSEEFSEFDHIYIHRKDDEPWYVRRVNHTEADWEEMVDFMTEHDFDYRYSYKPKTQADYETVYREYRGDELIEGIIERIIEETK